MSKAPKIPVINPSNPKVSLKKILSDLQSKTVTPANKDNKTGGFYGGYTLLPTLVHDDKDGEESDSDGGDGGGN